MADDKKLEDKNTDKKKADDQTPTPTQKEADEAKVKLTGGPNAKVEPRSDDEPPEQLPPTPTQAENDAAKQAAMNETPEAPPPEPLPEGTRKRAVEAEKPGGYTTRGRE